MLSELLTLPSFLPPSSFYLFLMRVSVFSFISLEHIHICFRFLPSSYQSLSVKSFSFLSTSYDSRTPFASRCWPVPAAAATALSCEQVAGPGDWNRISSIFARTGAATSAGYKFGNFRVDSTSRIPSLTAFFPAQLFETDWRMENCAKWMNAKVSQKKKSPF